MQKKDLYTTAGFLLMSIGLTSIVLNVVGVEWVLLKWMNKLSGLTGFLIKLVMIIAGIIIIYLNKADWKNE
ncbi:MAG TPA: hypothetical protein PLC76_14195 [Saprospiraceae bacterium]|jgi:hypothetical protein|nr:MAG: hypothetical protein UZ08_BCD001000530 [Candidatus Parvibacillus calidus]MBX2936019.1 hypothetical protein [Saprospiraceae bacterium]MBK7741499.1 hypothetical protein [Candidatus Parvibacillus calidus]MBX7180218.1 hypothetical protein [Saprospiraceae bacterium]MCB0590173.1 hypothetical protein [Saprospiraceae bacterium]